eukprot:1157124-Pelagomonas_calceolata.AAC.2
MPLSPLGYPLFDSTAVFISSTKEAHLGTITSIHIDIWVRTARLESFLPAVPFYLWRISRTCFRVSCKLARRPLRPVLLVLVLLLMMMRRMILTPLNKSSMFFFCWICAAQLFAAAAAAADDDDDYDDDVDKQHFICSMSRSSVWRSTWWRKTRINNLNML